MTNPRSWLEFAREDSRMAELAFEDVIYTQAWFHAQQCVEKALKAACLDRGLAIRKTHSIDELTQRLQRAGVLPILTDEESALLDTIYLPSKYPLGSVLPDYEPDRAVAQQCYSLAERTLCEVSKMIG